MVTQSHSFLFQTMECVQVFILMTLCVATDIFHFDIESDNSGNVLTEDEIFGWHVGDVSLNSIYLIMLIFRQKSCPRF